MTIREAWRSVRRDPEWKKKVALTAAVNLIPYVGPFVVMGYGLNYARATAWGIDRDRLPEWSAFGDHGREGLYAFVVSLVYSIPLVVVYLPAELALFGVLFASVLRDPSHLPVVAVIAWGVAFAVFSMAASFAYAPVSYSALLEYAMYDRVDAAWRFRVVLSRVRGNLRALFGLAARAFVLSAAMLLASLAIDALVVGALLLPFAGTGALPLMLPLAITLGYALLFLLLAAFGGVAHLVVYRMLGSYARSAYRLPPPPAAAA